MKVKIGNRIISSESEPIMLILDAEEKDLISNMAKEDNHFCMFPEGWCKEQVIDFMHECDLEECEVDYD